MTPSPGRLRCWPPQADGLDQVSLEEIDWLSRLRQGLEKTRQGFVTGLLDNLGDDP